MVFGLHPRLPLRVEALWWRRKPPRWLLRSCLVERTSRSGNRGVSAFAAAFDGESRGIGEFDLDILLLDPWKFAMEFIDIASLLHVEFGGERLHDRSMMLGLIVIGTIVVVEVVQQTKERMERGWVAVVRNKRSWEE